MNTEEIRNYCLSKPFAEEDLPFGPDTLVFKVHGKIFLLMGLEKSPVSFNVKCHPDLALELRESYSCVAPGYHMNKKHWNTITIDHSVSPKLLFEWIDHSYDLVAKPNNKTKPKINK
ncbi:MAG TPA: MmcQ/YjbR family DNA-binding protein [Niabella sp.]|nr:MmcQ/YjbR family DNA-binding protein [Niabella sp.]HOZ97698.1 MmcQ/YjbR family DNA-binding protein [Niabella sp.]HQW14004.1 MmcQ/YjbR family DNA-binding protein [Niabella sp.]HQX19453.1 MmcQ/YjbR family DNA-binding protein [Niabella sp.]HQX40194.1 MmcQ/YjbR family DNA-binding protein [Niabella sp.]